MNDQQLGETPCAVDLSASSLPQQATSEQASADVFTTTIDAQQPESGFDGFGFSEALLKTLANKGYSEPSPIQKAAFPELMLGRDLVGQAQTGTGKTAAFALPLLERLASGQTTPQALVLAPTRELAMQVADSFKAYSAGHPHLKVLAVYGGTDFRSQINTLRRGVDVVVGTPGRVMDHMRQGTLDTSGLRSLVLDEADRMLDMGFEPQIKKTLLDIRPDRCEIIIVMMMMMMIFLPPRQTVMTSATWPEGVRRLAVGYMKNPVTVFIGSLDLAAVHSVTQRIIRCSNDKKDEELFNFLTKLDKDEKVEY